MTEQPLVSILIANFNNARFITETLDSALGQTYSNLEIVIIDDGSTDDSRRVIKEYMARHQDVAFKYVQNSDNQGCGRIKRQCIESSSGAFFTFLDPEDTIVPEAIATLMQVLLDHLDLGIAYCTHFLCNEALEPQGVSTYPGKIPDGQSHLTSTGGHISALAVCRRAVYDKTEGINATYQVSEDQDLYLKMEEQAPVCYIDKPMYYYRKHGHNSSWNERKVFNNFYWRYYCVKAAYTRRKKSGGHVANLSKLEMNRMSFSFFLRLGKEQWREKKYFSAAMSWINMMPFLYTQWK